MPKINRKNSEKDEFDASSKRLLKHDELTTILMDIRKAGGKGFDTQFINFLSKIGVVSQVKYTPAGFIESYAVVWDTANQFSGTEMIPGTGILYEKVIPYHDWMFIRDQIEKYLYSREQAEKKDTESKLNLNDTEKEDF